MFQMFFCVFATNVPRYVTVAGVQGLESYWEQFFVPRRRHWNNVWLLLISKRNYPKPSFSD